MIFPTVHLNGTDGETLESVYGFAELQVQSALEALCETRPNGRDYYTQGDAFFTAAIAEHEARVAALAKIRNEMHDLRRGVQKQNAARKRRP